MPESEDAIVGAPGDAIFYDKDGQEVDPTRQGWSRVEVVPKPVTTTMVTRTRPGRDGADHQMAALWVARELLAEGLDAKMASVGGSPDGWAVLMEDNYVLNVKHLPGMQFAGPADYRWDTAAFETVEALKIRRRDGSLPAAYILVADGYQGFMCATFNQYDTDKRARQVVSYTRRKFTDPATGITTWIPMAEIARDDLLDFEQFVERVKIGAFAPKSTFTKSLYAWQQVTTLTRPVLPALLGDGYPREDDPRLDPDNCLGCGVVRAPGRPAYCRQCGKVSRDFSHEEATRDKRPKTVIKLATRSKRGRLIPSNTSMSLLDQLDEALGRKPRGLKRADGERYRDVLYEDEVEPD